MQNILFICSRNRLRSPTAEAVFSNLPNIKVSSAGLADDAEELLTAEHLEDINIIFVMEKTHQIKLNKLFSKYLKNVKVVCLNIPDKYTYMQPKLVELFRKRVPPHFN